KNLAHINDDKHDNRDQLVVQKSTVEEARSTRSQYERMKPNYDNIVETGEQEEEPLNQDSATKDEDFSLTSDEKKHALIHISRDFFDLSQQAVKSLAEIQPDIDTSEASKNDARKYASLSDSVGIMASELAENLRQILEPSIANRLQGDYRTGKRLNMRR
uniref:Uncharacterized protein n=1 Tax=Panagrolaimus sp. ES5 TaxID=591445 RepID=A0AC34GM53_9BILA